VVPSNSDVGSSPTPPFDKVREAGVQGVQELDAIAQYTDIHAGSNPARLTQSACGGNGIHCQCSSLS